jgi:hypothetical protein
MLNSEGGLSQILSDLPADGRREAARSLVRLSRALELQDKFDAEVAAALDRILNAPRSVVRPLAKRIREIAANV